MLTLSEVLNRHTEKRYEYTKLKCTFIFLGMTRTTLLKLYYFILCLYSGKAVCMSKTSFTSRAEYKSWCRALQNYIEDINFWENEYNNYFIK